MFSLCVALWMQRRGCSLPGVYRAQEEYSEQTTRHPSSIMPLLRSGRSLFRGSVTDSWSSWPAPALHHERRTAHILQQEKSRPPRVTFMQAGPLPGVLLPETLSVTVCLLPSRGSHSAPYRAKISGRDQYRQRPSSPKNLLPFSCQAARTQKKRGNTYE